MSAVSGIWRWTLLVSLLAVLGYALAAGDPLVALGVPASFAAWLASGGSRPRAVPRLLINLMLLAVLAWATLLAIRGPIDIELFCNVMTLLTLVKLLDRRQVYDARQLLALGLFLGIGSILTSNSLAPALGSVALGVALTAATLRVEIAAVAERSAEPLAAAVGVRRGREAMRGITSGSVAFMLLLGAAVFVLAPRSVGVSTFGNWGGAALGATVGFSDEVNLGTGGLISDSPEPVMDVRFLDASGELIGGPAQRFYLRGAVLDRTDERGNWRHAEDLPTQADEARPHSRIWTDGRRHRIVGAPRLTGPSVRQEITIRRVPQGESMLFALWEPAQLTTDASARIVQIGDGRMIAVSSRGGRMGYTVESIDKDARASRGAPVGPDDPYWAQRAPDPSVHPNVARRAAEILSARGLELPGGVLRAGDENTAAAALASSFANAGFTYSLSTLAAPPGRDPTEWFLTEARTGHCEYYAASMAAMCRAVGLPARVITGYVANEHNSATGYYIVRASDAHAWVEAQVAPGLWKTFDPTPAADFARVHVVGTTPLDRIRQLYETIEFAWIRSIVSYDEESRRDLLGRQRDTPRAPAPIDDPLGPFLDRVRLGGINLVLGAMASGLLVGLGVYALGLAGLYACGPGRGPIAAALSRLLAGLWPHPRGPEASAALASALAAALDRALRRSGHPRPAWAPFKRHIDSSGLAHALPSDALGALRDVADLIYRWRFAGQHASLAEYAQATARLRALPRRANPITRDPGPSDPGSSPPSP